MVRITVAKQDMVEKLRNDPKKREEFLTNTHKLITDMGVEMSHSELKEKFEAQLEGKPDNVKVAGVALIINILGNA